MNQYKIDWYLATQVVSDYIMNRSIASDEAAFTEQGMDPEVMTSYAMQSVGKATVTWALPKIMWHLSRNEVAGKLGTTGRLVGKLGMRTVPLLGTALLIKDAYDLWDYFTD